MLCSGIARLYATIREERKGPMPDNGVNSRSELPVKA